MNSSTTAAPLLIRRFRSCAAALSPVGPVRAVGVVEMPIAAIAGRRLFKERLSPLQLVAGAVTAVGVVMAAIG